MRIDAADPLPGRHGSEVGRGVFRLDPLEPVDIAAADRLIGRFAELEIGLADASLVVLANRYGVRDLLTLDGATSGRSMAWWPSVQAPARRCLREWPARTSEARRVSN